MKKKEKLESEFRKVVNPEKQAKTEYEEEEKGSSP